MSFTFPIRIYWEDTDAGGIVFYANYLKFMERARTEWLRSLGISQQALKEQTGGMFVVTDTQLKYVKPARLDDVLSVSATIIEKSRVSITIEQQISLLPAENKRGVLSNNEHPASPEVALAHVPSIPTPICQGTICIAWVNALTLKPGRIPLSVTEALN